MSGLLASRREQEQAEGRAALITWRIPYTTHFSFAIKHIYDKIFKLNKKSIGETLHTMSTAIYYIEVNMICIVTLMLLLTSLPKGEYQSEYNSERGRYYKMLLTLAIIMCACDLISGVFRGASFAGAGALLWVSNGAYLVSSLLIGYFWVLYSMQVLTGYQNKKIRTAATVITLIDFLLIASAPLNGWVFTIDSANLYHRGDLVAIHWVIIYAFELIPSIVAPFTSAERREKHAVTLFIILPAIASVLQSIFYGVSCGQAGLTAGMLLIYILLHNKEIDEAKLKAALLDEISNTDTLTGLNNRRAFETALDRLKNEDWVGAVFMDLNGLKRTNDTQGHKAGDAMICRFAQLLRSYFMPQSIFRVSGDEFVILSTDRAIFDKQYSAMRAEIGDKAAAGCVQGSGENIVEMVNNAEKLMYEDKNAYYARSRT